LFKRNKKLLKLKGEQESHVYHAEISSVQDSNDDNKQIRKATIKLSLCFINHHAMRTYWGSEGVVTNILNFGTARCRLVLSFMSRPLYSRRKSPW
jgi:hypothetical protein